MLNQIYSEFRKLVSLRSTYVMMGLGLVMAGLVGLWGIGYKTGAGFGPDGMEDAILQIVQVMSTFVGLIAILMICNEYRFNTIYYTLTASNNRMKVVGAKIVVASVFALFFALIAIAWTVLMVTLGIKFGGHTMVPQEIHAFDVLWKSVAFMVSTAWFCMLLGFLTRNLTFSIVTFFMLPVVETLATMLLKINGNYLPNTAQDQIMALGGSVPGVFSPLASLGVFAVYVTVMFIASSVLFVKRDAN
ncbi:MAG TPA: ABC transporter permease [Candidatus Saccharimonadales bacterium]